MHKKKKKHTLRNSFIILFLLVLFSGAAYGMTSYRGVNNSVNSSFEPSGLAKERDVTSEVQKKRPISILLMGTDTGALGRDYKGRTDSMMIITLNPKDKKTTVTSIPRDTAVHVPGFGTKKPSKINAAYSLGQTKTAITTVQKMLNVPIDFYAMINMGGMSKVIDQAGGVDIKPSLSFEYGKYNFIAGKKTHMDGEKALAYSRMRYDDPQGDYGRQTRQRAILMALIGKSASIKTLLNQDFIKSLTEQIQTDLIFDDLTAIAKDYNSVRKDTDETHLQGQGANINGESMEIVDKKELQRVTDYIRDNLDLPSAKTGNIEYSVDKKAHASKLSNNLIDEVE